MPTGDQLKLKAELDLVTKGFEKKLRNSAKTANNEMKRVKGSFDSTNTSILKTQDLLQGLGGAAVLAGLKKLSSVAETFEFGLVGVGKTTNIVGEELKALGAEIQNLSFILPVATNTLLNIAEVAGQLGVKGTGNILAFTSAIGKLRLATDLVNESFAAASLARILTVTGTDLKKVENFASVITLLGNNSAATESEITNVATRLAQTTAAFDTSAQDVAAMSATIREFGERAEAGGSAIGIFFRKMNRAIRVGGKEFQILQKVTGKSQQEMLEQLEDNATNAFVTILEGLKKLDAVQVENFFDAMKINTNEVNRVITPLIKKIDVLKSKLTLARGEFINPKELDREVAQFSKTFHARMTSFKNGLTAVFVDVGQTINDTIMPALAAIGDWIKKNRQEIATVLSAMVKPLLIISSAAVIAGVAKLAGVFKTLSVSIKLSSRAFLFNPVILGIAAVSLVVLAFITKLEKLKSKNTEVANSFQKAWDDVLPKLKENFKGLFDFIKDELSDLKKNVSGLSKDLGLEKGTDELVGDAAIAGLTNLNKKITLFRMSLAFLSAGLKSTIPLINSLFVPGSEARSKFQFEGIGKELEEDMKKILGVVSKAGDAITRRLVDINSGFLHVLGDKVKILQFFEPFVSGLQKIKQALDSITPGGGIKNLFSIGDVPDNFLDKMSDGFEGLKKSMSDAALQAQILRGEFGTMDESVIKLISGLGGITDGKINAIFMELANILQDNLNIEKNTEKTNAYNEAISELETEIKILTGEFPNLTNSMVRALAIQGLLNVEGETDIARRKEMISLLTQQGIALEIFNQRQEKIAAATQKANDMQSRANQLIESIRTPLQVYIDQVRELNILREANKLTEQELIDLMKRYEEQLADATEKTSVFGDMMETSMNRVSDSMVDAMVKGQDMMETLKNSFRALITDMIQQAFRLLVIDKIMGLFGGGGFNKKEALGGIQGLASLVQGGQGKSNAKGAVVNKKMLFPTSSGIASMSEHNRPEAIMPLANVGGKLGVAMAGGGSGGGTTIIIDARGSNGDAAVQEAVRRGITEAAPSLINTAVVKSTSNILDINRRQPQIFGRA